MKKTKLLWPSLLAGLLALSSGCATRALWKTAPLDAYNEPDDLPGLRLFEAKQSNDVLVVYREYSERHDYSRARAYLLGHNLERLEEHRRPHFVGTNRLGGMNPLPMLSETNPPPVQWQARPYAVVAANEQSFRLFSADGETNTFDLPVYNDGRGRCVPHRADAGHRGGGLHDCGRDHRLFLVARDVRIRRQCAGRFILRGAPV